MSCGCRAMGCVHAQVLTLVLSCSEEGYWVGKASLRGWRQLALEQLEEDEEETKHNNGKTNGEGPEITATKGNHNRPLGRTL